MWKSAPMESTFLKLGVWLIETYQITGNLKFKYYRL